MLPISYVLDFLSLLYYLLWSIFFENAYNRPVSTFVLRIDRLYVEFTLFVYFLTVDCFPPPPITELNSSSFVSTANLGEEKVRWKILREILSLLEKSLLTDLPIFIDDLVHCCWVQINLKIHLESFPWESSAFSRASLGRKFQASTHWGGQRTQFDPFLELSWGSRACRPHAAVVVAMCLFDLRNPLTLLVVVLQIAVRHHIKWVLMNPPFQRGLFFMAVLLYNNYFCKIPLFFNTT